MKTKPILSEEALRKVLKPVADGGTVAPEPTAEELAAAEAAKLPKKEDTVTAEDTILALEAKITELTETVNAHAEEAAAALAAEKDTHTAEITAMEASIQSLKEIVSGQISAMRVGLSLGAIDVSDFKPEAVVAEFNSISEKFMKIMPPGSLIPEPVEEETTAKVINNSVDAAAYNSLGFTTRRR